MKSFKQGVSRAARAAFAASALIAVLGLAACGGGNGTQIQPFHPTRIVTFGDESSYINALGQKYTINGIDPTSGLADCAVNPIWVQILASAYGMSYPQCDPNHSAAPQGLMLAVPGAKVADLQSTMDKYFSGNYFSDKDLVTVLIGTNDILELYSQFPAQNQDSLVAQAKVRGQAAADIVNRIADAGGRVIVSTLPDLGLTPFANAETTAHGDVNRADLLTALTSAFNIALRVELHNDGRNIGLTLLDETVQSIVKFPSAYSFADIADAACLPNVAIQNCSTKTLFPNASGDTWLWANNVLLSSGGQARLGSLAVTRAQNNPF
ncbi:MAG TPA: SGNH/GDSL hydrolase family protein [Burkholderiaceae bacterium]